MNLWRNCNVQKQDEAALDTCYMPTIMQESGASQLDEIDRSLGTRIFGTENRRKSNTMDEMLKLKESSCSSFHNQNYVEEIKEIQSYIDTVKRLTRPGCSVETLDVALSTVSSLINTLSEISSKEQIIHSSL